jgi:hypothetical protein
MTIGILRNRLAAMSLSKDYLNIIDHIEDILTSSVARLGLVVCLTFKMLAFLSNRVVCRKKSAMAKVHDLLTLFQGYTFNITETVCACIISLI